MTFNLICWMSIVFGVFPLENCGKTWKRWAIFVWVLDWGNIALVDVAGLLGSIGLKADGSRSGL